MKKNRTLRAASLLLALTLITSCFVGSTFAKYTTKDDGTDTARVAKWGVTVLVSGSLFGENYVPNSATASKDMISASAQQSVDSQGAVSGIDIKNIVAPGTKSDEGLLLGVQGHPEVAYSVSYENKDGVTNQEIWLLAGDYGVLVKTDKVTFDNHVGYYYKNAAGYVKATVSLTAAEYDSITEWYELHDTVTVTENYATGGKYYPISWTVKKLGSTGTLAESTPATYRTVADMTDALDAEFTENSTDIVNVAIDDRYLITWEWAFTDQQDGADTILGNLMSNDNSGNYVVVKTIDSGNNYTTLTAGTDYNLTVAFGAKITVEQVN
ncbi:MAG: hypothetical protein IJA58_08210 [Lachnospiraceae bacterium]|nr:hypothetical protein [Lachnospiraceae bacterium]